MWRDGEDAWSFWVSERKPRELSGGQRQRVALARAIVNQALHEIPPKQKPESQAKWHIGTGYFAINPAAYNEEIVKQEWEKYPQFKVTVEQLQHTKPSVATQGALISVFPESRQQVVTALENLYQGTDPQKALDQAVEGKPGDWNSE
jgi:hypothetical protein